MSATNIPVGDILINLSDVKLMPLDPNTKTAQVRQAMANGDWVLAIRLAGKLRSLGEHEKPIRRAKDALNNPDLYKQLGYDLEKLQNTAIAALKDRFSRSWEAVKDGENRGDEGGDQS